ncbi:DUF6414 family protein [Clostridium perfringens]|uniref:DUF6414 family protein n=1 Tax=Clostridium perfringens TaxID=1502 RepID=UPI002971CA86|nr:DUF6414 family protein [Clostridium perfringens]MDK0728319.1 DUF6414 family protein [Clostridium perfringens]MDK0803619.1 DUF6414 family protein [Clostridium perfringens]MDM0547932.1 DUF6414 family protein [Clostridium perfringens]MDM0561868.1 DUF6414 family protein [Clostridium perfringens]MDM0565507.1 DUF6414 family protein [Clostridium perfringens]
MANKTKNSKMMKVIYFDEIAATDYITIQNGGQIDWTSTENKERLAKIIAEIDMQAKGGFNLFSFIKASVSGNANANIDKNTSKLIKSTITNTLLTDYISIADKDKNIRKFHNDGVYAPENSISMYRMYSSYLNIVPKEQIPINLEGLNNALLGERGYYQMLLNSEKDPSCVLRFNINAFKNDYSLADLSKMNLSYFGVKVGQCTKEQLSLEKEFEIKPSNNAPNVKEIVTGETSRSSIKLLDVYDIVLAGVMSIE